jgi:stage III sporulation protein AH
VCAGILATKVNSPLYTDASELTQTTDASKEDFFTASKLKRDNEYNSLVPTYQAGAADPEADKDAKAAMSKKLQQITDNNQNEKKIETQLKGKGYTDSFCQINDEKVSVYVKAETITAKEAADIKNLVLGITKIKDVEISFKQ